MHKLPFALLLFLFACSPPTQTVEQTRPTTSPPPSLPNLSPKTKIDRPPLLISKDFGKTWTSVSEGLPNDLQVTFLEAIGNEIIIASDNKGLYLSSENRTKWKAIGTMLPNPKINALHVAKGTLYVGIYRKGIYKSDDGGETWMAINYDLPNLNVQAILKNAQELSIGTDEGIFTLAPNAKTWKGTSVKAQILSLYDYEDNLVAGTSQGTVLSKDGGQTWDWIRREGAVHYTHNIKNRIVELAINGDLVYSDDWGSTWVNTVYEPRHASYIYEIIQHRPYLLLSNNYGIHRSIDNGQTWKLIYETEVMGFFDFLLIDDVLYGGTRIWDEYRGRKN